MVCVASRDRKCCSPIVDIERRTYSEYCKETTNSPWFEKLFPVCDAAASGYPTSTSTEESKC